MWYTQTQFLCSALESYAATLSSLDSSPQASTFCRISKDSDNQTLLQEEIKIQASTAKPFKKDRNSKTLRYY
jgi:hypothetical protein